MSHFTNLKTNLQNLFYLEKALNRLQIEYKREKIDTGSLKSGFHNINLIIPQSNGYYITFCWNGTEYELVVDMNCWKQSCPVQSFIDKITQQYAGEVIIHEGQKIEFQPVKYQKNQDGSNTLVLERWHSASTPFN